MICIGERLNGLFSTVARAIDERDTATIQRIASEQVAAGASVLDLNTGPGRKDSPAVMQWLVETVQSTVDVALSIDAPDPAVIEAGLEVCTNPVWINSTTAEPAKMSRLFPLAAAHDASIIGLTMDASGVPSDAETRAELAMHLLAGAMEHGVPTERLYLDPLVLPVSASQLQTKNLLAAMAQFKILMDPPPNTVVGLSNVSNNTKHRSLINRTYLVMLMAYGLSAAILDVEDEELMNALKTAEILLDQKLYADDYLRG